MSRAAGSHWPVGAWAASRTCPTATDALSDQRGAARSLEHALDLAEPEGLLLPFRYVPVRELLQRQSRTGTKHASLIADILGMYTGAPRSPGHLRSEPLHDKLSDSELRVLRYLPTNLRTPEIAKELSVSPATVRTHIRHVYAKLGVHTRTAAV